MAGQIITVEYKSEKTSPKAIMLALDKFTLAGGAVSKAQLNLVDSVAASGRKILINQFTSRRGSGSLFYNNPNWILHRKSGNMEFKAGVGYIDSRGRMLIGFTNTGSSKSPRRKSAHLHSFPMNLWEHDSARGAMGKWIMTVKLPPLVAAAAQKHMARVEKELDVIANRMVEGK